MSRSRKYETSEALRVQQGRIWDVHPYYSNMVQFKDDTCKVLSGLILKVEEMESFRSLILSVFTKKIRKSLFTTINVLSFVYKDPKYQLHKEDILQVEKALRRLYRIVYGKKMPPYAMMTEAPAGFAPFSTSSISMVGTASFGPSHEIVEDLETFFGPSESDLG